jgi:hypothetical protein
MLLRTAKSCGPDAPTLASSSRSCVGPTGLRQNISVDDGGKRARSPGRARHKPLKPLRAGMPGVPVYSLLLVCVLPIQSAHEAAGAAGTRHSPRPPWGREINAQLGRIVSRGREVVSGTSRLKIELRTRATNSASSRTRAARSGTHNHRCPCYGRLGLQFHPTANIGGYGSRPSPGRRKSPNGLSVIARSAATNQSILSSLRDGLLRGACHRVRLRATRWFAMTESTCGDGSHCGTPWAGVSYARHGRAI